MLRDGALHALARRPAWEIWQNLRLWFAYVQHLEIGACSRHAHFGRSRALVRDLNRVLEGLMTRFKKALDNGRRWLLFAPQRGKFWGHACVARMLAYDGVFRTPVAGAGRAREDIQVVALHNCRTLHQSVMELDCSSEQGILQLIPDFQLFKNVEDALLHNILDGLGLATAAPLPTSPSLWTASLGSQLSGSTRRLQRAPVQESVVPVLADLLGTMQPGQELEHLKFLLRWADHRGSDVRLLTNSVIHGSSQPAPYPAFAWDWESFQQYPWRATQHINVLELTTLLNFLRMRAATGEVAGKRIFHIFDSLVAASVAAKGRSSARILNRICRRISAVSLCSGCLVVSLWTVSGWQHSDSANRVAVRRVMVKRRSTHRVLKRHLKFTGIERAGVERFFRFSEFFFARLPQNGTELNYFLGEFVNHLYQDDSTHMRRCGASFQPGVTTRRWHACTWRNWSRTLTIRRAPPLPVDIIMGIIGVAAVQDKWALCGAMYIVPWAPAHGRTPLATGLPGGRLSRHRVCGPISP